MTKKKTSAPKRIARSAIGEQLASLDSDIAATLLETVDLMGSYVDPRERFMFDDQLGLPIGSSADGRSATDISNFDDERQLADARDDCRRLARQNSFAIGFHENMINFVMGAEPKCVVVANKNENVRADDIRAIQQVLDVWSYENDWSSRQKESVMRYDRDGEFFRRMFVDRLGELRVRFVEPNWVRQRPGDLRPESLFGVEVASSDGVLDVESVVGYWIDGQLVPAEDVLHVKANVDANVRRGVPTTWPIRHMLRSAAKVLENIGKVSQIQTKIALIRRHMGATKSGVESLRSTNADYSHTSTATGKTRYAQQLPDGAIIDASANTQYDYPAGGIDVVKFGGGVQAILRGAAARICFPEFMFTSDASNANFSSTMIAEGPAVRMFERRQSVHKAADLQVLWRVLEHNVERGVLPEELLQRIELQIEMPGISTRNRYEEAQTNQILKINGILSDQTWATKAGLDYEQEQKNKSMVDPPRVPAPSGQPDPLDAANLEAKHGAWEAGYPFLVKEN